MGTEIVKHISIQEIDQAVADIWEYINSIESEVPMADKEQWCKEVKAEVVEGTQQIFKCNGHYALVEHAYMPLRDEPCVFIVQPQCDRCSEAAETVAHIRDVKWKGTMKLTNNEVVLTTEKRV
tara:strand:+ start:265 stop:633 length:369 start_codon:yes stop_codon:yes gene_type:complete